MPHESCVPRTKVSHRPACEHPRENDTWSGHSSVKEPFSPGRAAAGGRPSLAPGEEWPSPPAKEETRLPNGSGMKAPSGRRSPDHSLPITCPNLPPGGYFVKPTFDRISWTTVADVYGTTVEQADTKCVLYTPEGLTAYKGYMAPTFTRLQFFSSDSTVRK